MYIYQFKFKYIIYLIIYNFIIFIILELSSD